MLFSPSKLLLDPMPMLLLPTNLFPSPFMRFPSPSILLEEPSIWFCFPLITFSSNGPFRLSKLIGISKFWDEADKRSSPPFLLELSEVVYSTGLLTTFMPDWEFFGLLILRFFWSLEFNGWMLIKPSERLESYVIWMKKYLRWLTGGSIGPRARRS